MTPAVPSTDTQVHLWLSAPVLPPEGGAIVLCLINPTETDFHTGLGGRFEIADGSGWAFFGSLSAAPPHWNSLGKVWIGPHSGMTPAIGFSARAGEIGQAEYLMIPPLESGQYRFWHQDGTGSDGEVRKAYGEFLVSESAPMCVPIETKKTTGESLFAFPILLPPSGGQISIRGLSREGVHEFPVDLRVQPWTAGEWGAPSLSLTPRELTEYPFGPAVDLSPLPAGPYRLSCDHPDLGQIGRVVWVVDDLPGAT